MLARASADKKGFEYSFNVLPHLFKWIEKRKCALPKANQNLNAYVLEYVIKKIHPIQKKEVGMVMSVFYTITKNEKLEPNHHSYSRKSIF